MKKLVTSEKETEKLAKKFSKSIRLPLIVGFKGDLGAGKTAFIRGLIRNYNKNEIVKSPTFGLIEEYNYKDIEILHADLYRIKENEKNYFDFNSYFNDKSLFLIEWIENDSKILQNSDILINIEIKDKEEERIFKFNSNSEAGKKLVEHMKK